jgi:hypothetical protein
VATLHDPAGSTLPFLASESIARTLGGYAAVAVALTIASDPRVGAKLQELGVRVVSGGLTGEGRRAALQAGGPDHGAYFACDFDRWLHWVTTWPEELAMLPERVARLGSGRRPPPWYVCLGRTARAFRTHPAAQRLPETATNRALSLTAGQSLDAVAGAAWLTAEAAMIILAESCESTAATDLEWPALILRRDATRLRGLRCEGLSWETPDFHAADIAAAGGLRAWTRAIYDKPAMWSSRLRLAADSTAALVRVLGESRAARPPNLGEQRQ